MRSRFLKRHLAVGLLSAAVMAYEILLVRVFAIEHFHHLASLAIGLAMLGFGAAGVLVAGSGASGASAGARIAPAGALATVALAIAPELARRVALDPMRLLWDATEWPRLAAVVALLAIPFLLGALAILFSLVAGSTRPGSIYGASFAGSGLGAVAAVAVLWVLSPARALAAPVALAALGATCAAAGDRRARGVAWTILAVATAGWALARPSGELRISPYKGQSQVE